MLRQKIDQHLLMHLAFLVGQGLHKDEALKARQPKLKRAALQHGITGYTLVQIQSGLWEV